MLPNLIVIGAAKCGTSSMHRLLSGHPDIYMSASKELNFFATAGWWRSPGQLSAGWSMGLEWYEDHFRGGHAHAIRGESSPGYTMEDGCRLAAERISRTIPDTRFVYLVRDPVARIRSHYAQDLSVRLISPRITLHDVLESGPRGTSRLNAMWSGYVHTGLYARQLSVYLDYFSLDQFAVVPLQRLRDDAENTMRELFAFLGVSADFVPPNLHTRYNRQDQRLLRSRFLRDVYWTPSVRKLVSKLPAGLKRFGKRIVIRKRPYDIDRLARISPRHQAQLREIYSRDKRELERITGLDLSHWSV